MKRTILTALAIPCLLTASAQVSISNPVASPDPSAMLDVKSTNRGFLMPRVADRANVSAPATGLMIFETATNAVLVYNGSSWMQVSSGGSGTQWLANGTHIYNGNTGNVGIGINLPAAKFHLVGNLRQDNGTITLNNPTAEIDFQNAGVDKAFLQLSGNNLRMGTVSANDAGRFIVRTNATDRLIVDSTGNVQIIGEQDAELTAHGYLMLGRTTGTNLIFDNNDIMARNNGAPSDLIMQNDGGSVGIGTAADERLDVNGNLKFHGSRLIKFETGLAGTGSPSVSRYVPGLQFVREGSAAQLGKMEYVDTANAANFLRFYTGASVSNDLTVTTDHNVGVGTQFPQVKMQVAGTGEIFRLHAVTDPLMQFTTGLLGAATKKGFLDVNGNDFRIGTNSGNDNGNFISRVNGVDVLKISPAWNVGIGLGAGTPQGKLHVQGKIIADADGETIKVDGVNPAINFYNNGTFRSFITQDNPATGPELYIGANGTLRLDATTQVAIGSVVSAANANYKLAIDGKVVCEELKVKLSQNWPDYVFKKAYNLMPLSQLQNFIAQNNRLPNIPPAATVEKEGIQVGDMQKKLMEKVEELTLYILDLQKQVDELKTVKKTNHQ